MKPNKCYSQLESSYLFYNISQKSRQYAEAHPDNRLLLLGIGDVTLPLSPVVIEALHKAVEDQAAKATFRGYMPECGAEFLKDAIRERYNSLGVSLTNDEIFVTSGAADDIGSTLDLFDQDNTALIIEPAYPAYVDCNVIAGHRLIHLPSSADCGFAPLPDSSTDCDIIYICSPNNPTGSVFDRTKLKAWVDYANTKGAVIIFDSAYESFIEDEDVPHSIYEIDGSLTCAIEICSLSKTAGFTGTRCGYTVVPKALERQSMSLNQMWVRSRTTKTNGVSYIIQRGAQAALSPEGRRQCMENIAVYKANAQVLMKALDECGIWYCGGKNAPYIWLRCPGGMSSWEFFDLLLDKAQIVGTPGSGFGQCGEGYFRLSTFGDPDDTKEAARRLKELFGR